MTTAVREPRPAIRPRERHYTPCLVRLDGLGWTDSVIVSALGARIAVRADTPELLAALIERLPPRAKPLPAHEGVVDRMISVIGPAPGPRRGTRKFGFVYLDHVEAIRTQDLAEVLERYDGWLRFSLAQFARRGIVVHGGAVGWRGRALLLPATTGSGKSHLVAALIGAGADYISDEHILLDAQGRVHPWDKPLSIRDLPGGRQRDVPAAAFGARSATRPLPVAAILSTRFAPDARWNPQPLTPSLGALELFANTIAARLYPRRVLTILGETARKAPAWKTDRPDAATVLPQLFDLIDRSASRTGR